MAYKTEAKNRIDQLLNQTGTVRISALRQAFQDAMTSHCGVFRSETVMAEGLSQVQALKAQYDQIFLDDKQPQWNTEIIEALELQNIMAVGELILTSAIKRQESRGSHAREDFPDRRDDQFLYHTLASFAGDQVKVDYMPVVINRFEPKERKY
jgi:succinate dehydrogenase / fumarate reductase flavoprotein subunit